MSQPMSKAESFLEVAHIDNMFQNLFFPQYQPLVQINTILSIKLCCFFSYLSVLTFVLGAQKNHLIETVILSTHNICLGK